MILLGSGKSILQERGNSSSEISVCMRSCPGLILLLALLGSPDDALAADDLPRPTPARLIMIYNSVNREKRRNEVKSKNLLTRYVCSLEDASLASIEGRNRRGGNYSVVFLLA